MSTLMESFVPELSFSPDGACYLSDYNYELGAPYERCSYTLRSVTMSSHVKYRGNPLACKIQEDSACNTGDSACSSAKKHGQWSSKNKKTDLSCTYTGHLASHYWECSSRSRRRYLTLGGDVVMTMRSIYDEILGKRVLTYWEIWGIKGNSW